MARTAYLTCPLCEATCGLEVELDPSADRITRVRGDRADVFSRGYLCPKGAALGHLDADPDRLTSPQVRRDGQLGPASWAEAFAAVDDGLGRVMEAHGRDAVALYLGNPVAHSLAGGLHIGEMRKVLGSRNVYSASTLDQMPKHVSCGYLFGSPLAVPVPDVDRADFLLILGADPWSSNGSLWTAPDVPGRLKALQARGGRFVVVDPRRSRTAQAADQHLAIRPGTDVYLLLGMVHTLFAAGLVDLGRLADHVAGVAELHQRTSEFTPDLVAPKCGIDAAVIRDLAHELATARRAAVYGRIGTTTVEFGTVTSWLVDALNILTGNLDRPGGAMFPLPAHTRRGTGHGQGFTTGRWRSRVRGLPEVFGELPAVTLADEIETAGEGQVRALITVAGNPALSVPNSGRLDRALATLEFVVSVDPYVNETTRHANVILPPPPPSRHPHYDLAFYNFSVRNIAKYARGVAPLDADMRSEDEILLRLTTILAGLGPDADLDALAEQDLARRLTRLTQSSESRVRGHDPAELRAKLAGETSAERLLEVRLRSGAYGDWFGQAPDGLSLRTLLNHPHGIDLGPLTERIPEILRTPSGQVELCPPALSDDLSRVRAALAEAVATAPTLVLIGRRHLRSNNSWLHNVPSLVKGRRLCTLQVNPADAARLGLVDGAAACVASRVGRLAATVEVTDDIAAGVVSLPHGWGHDLPGVQLSVASQHAGVNTNLLSDDLRLDPLSGTAVLNGVQVEVTSTQTDEH
jgi:anaerobic selenocysteine-containing dehydrogenase